LRASAALPGSTTPRRHAARPTPGHATASTPPASPAVPRLPSALRSTLPTVSEIGQGAA
jgi:hypothetical protein